VAATREGRRLTEEHRRAQVANQQSFVAEFLALWALLDAARLDVTGPRWVRAVLTLIDLFRQESADIAVDYYQRFRELEVPAAPPPPPVEFERYRTAQRVVRRVHRGNRGERVPLVRRRDRQVGLIINWAENDRAARSSLTVTGPVNIKTRSGRGENLRLAERNALVEATWAASRHVLNGARKTLLEVVDADKTALGWARVTDSDPCYFCAMLASRGPVYKTRQQAAFQPHDHCACTVEPVFSRDAAWPGRGREFQKLWNDHIRGRYSGKEAIRAWRRLLDELQRQKQRRAA
jgi:hypothetical protein